MKEVTHHEDRQDQTREQQRNAKNQAYCRALTKRQADYKTGYEKNQAEQNAEREAVGTVKRAARFRNVWSITVHLEKLLGLLKSSGEIASDLVVVTFTPAVGSCQSHHSYQC